MKCIIATITMAIIVYFASGIISEWFIAEGYKRILALAALILCGIGSYIIAIALLRTLTLAEIKGFLRPAA